MAKNAVRNPDKVLEIQRALEDGDLVAIHSRVRQAGRVGSGRGSHLQVKFQDDRIVELSSRQAARPAVPAPMIAT